MSFQRLFPSFPVLIGHSLPAGKPPPPPVAKSGWITYGSYCTDEKYPPFPTKPIVFQRRGVNVPDKGNLLTGVLAWEYLTGGHVNYLVAGDLDLDGTMEILATNSDYYLYCLLPDGTLKWKKGFPSWLVGITIYDIDGDGYFEILIACGDYNLYCLEHDGTDKWSYTTGAEVDTVPAVYDINDDGVVEIIFGSNDYKLYVLKPDGTLLWDYATGDKVWVAPTVADIDGDGLTEIVFASKDGYCYCFHPDGTVDWSFYTGYTGGPHATCFTDFEGDGLLEVFCEEHDATECILKCLNSDGTLRWTYGYGGTYGAPFQHSTYDIDGDGRIEVVTAGETGDNRVHCLDDTGVAKWTYLTGDMICGDSLGDIDNDGLWEVLIGGRDYNMYCLEHDGTLNWKFTTGGSFYYFRGQPVLEDVNGDGLIEAVFGNDTEYKIFCIVGG